MRYSQCLIPTIKEIPAEAEITSHRLMLRAGLMRKVASGTYFYMPAGWRTLRKIINIVRQEMDASGALETLAPSVQPIELWQQTGRDVDYGETLGTFVDRHGRGNVLSPTAEEVMTYIAAGEIKSYKQLPFNIYQISFKYRDEFRPRFGVLRSREFIMKDAYSFHANAESLDKTYRAMYDAYCKIFKRCGLEYVTVIAESGEMGGSGSHQFTIPCDNGEDVIVYTDQTEHAWNIEKAPVDPIVKQPADEKENIPAIEEVHTPRVGSIDEICAFLKKEASQMIKTLIYSSLDKTIAVLVRGDHEANPEKLTQALGGKQNDLAEPDVIKKVTGAEVGFAGPVGIAEKVDHVFIDHAVAAMTSAAAGANKTDYHILNVVPGRDFPLEGENIKVLDVRNAVDGDTYDGNKLLFKRGIEVGQVFKLGTKYSKKLNAVFLDEDNTEHPCLMGCYGIGINRIMASAVEQYNDENGIIWPITIAPWQVIITPAGKEEVIREAAEKIYTELNKMGVEVLLDDRDVRAGVKFKDADLLGIPIRITIGKKSIAQNNAELKLRNQQDAELISIDEVSAHTADIIQKLEDQINNLNG